jgi:mannose-6-phosphate isomerase-like protein (cupin superfamily)
VLLDVTKTVAHYHRGFDEVFFVLDGALNVRLFDPTSGLTSDHLLSEHEACIIPHGVHHQITSATQHNRLCVLCAPHFDREDETVSDHI